MLLTSRKWRSLSCEMYLEIFLSLFIKKYLLLTYYLMSQFIQAYCYPLSVHPPKGAEKRMEWQKPRQSESREIERRYRRDRQFREIFLNGNREVAMRARNNAV